MNTHTLSFSFVVEACNKLCEALAVAKTFLPERKNEIDQFLTQFTALRLETQAVKRAQVLIQEAQQIQRNELQKTDQNFHDLARDVEALAHEWKTNHQEFQAEMQALDAEERHALSRYQTKKVATTLARKKA